MSDSLLRESLLCKRRSSAFFIHLFGREISGSLAVLCEGTLHIVTSAKKCTMLESLQKGGPTTGVALMLHRWAELAHICELDSPTYETCNYRISKHDDNTAVYELLLNRIKQSRGGTKLGCLLKMKFRLYFSLSWWPPHTMTCSPFSCPLWGSWGQTVNYDNSHWIFYPEIDTKSVIFPYQL